MKIEIEDIVLGNDGGLYVCYSTEDFRPSIVYASKTEDILDSIKAHLDRRLATQKSLARMSDFQDALLLRGKAFIVEPTAGGACTSTD